MPLDPVVEPGTMISTSSKSSLLVLCFGLGSSLLDEEEAESEGGVGTGESRDELSPSK